MSDKIKVYTQVLKTLKKLMPTTKQQHVVTLAMMISGIVTGKKAQLSKMSGEIPLCVNIGWDTLHSEITVESESEGDKHDTKTGQDHSW